MAASDYVPIFFKNRLHLAGRPQMSTRPNRTHHKTGFMNTRPSAAASDNDFLDFLDRDRVRRAVV
jgi:hypothetical protein